MSGEEFVITGFSARFPQADNLVEFKEKLYGGVDFVTDNEERWPRGHIGLPARMGTIRDVSKFDAQFFGVNPKQADVMDPQMRLLLETTYEAIVDAGYDPDMLRGRNVGVFTGCFYIESEEAFSGDTDKIDGYGLLGNARAVFANRISYSFDFKGPSVSVDTACSSTMTALNHALLALRAGQCEAAIVGGSAVNLKPATSLALLRLGMLSPDGKCKSFDCDASGYVRSETVGAFFIQRASEARRIYAKLIHVKANVDGHKIEGMTVPSGKMQEKLLHDAYTEAEVDPLQVGYVEAHGTGTPVGDPQEMSAIYNVFCKPGRKRPLKIGAVKSNMGHSEGASGLCCIAKVILTMETGIIAANLHFNNANPKIPELHEGSIKVVDTATAFPGGPVGINSTGIGGANVHVILGSNTSPQTCSLSREKQELPRLVLVAGRSKESLEHTVDRLVAEGPHPDPAYALLNLVGQPNVKKFPFRSYVLVPVDDTGKDAIKAAAERAPLESRPLWFVFSGVGSQWTGMACQMMQFDVFARSIYLSHKLLAQYDIDLINAVTKGRQEEATMASVLASITAIQVALVDVLFAVGVRPDGMLGHSLGEIACAYADECFTAEQAVLCSYWRGWCIDQGNLPKGAMAATGLTWEEAKKRCRDGVVPACHNAEDSVTVSGPADAVAALVRELKADNVFAREVDSGNVAFHSEYVHGAGPPLLERLKEVVPKSKPRSRRWICSSVPESSWQSPLAQQSSPDYHVNNLLSPVLFHEATQHVPKDAVVIDIGPHCLMLPILRRTLGSDASCLGLMKRHVDNVHFFLDSLGKLHSLGVKLDLTPLYPPVPLPVPRGTPSIAHLVSWDHSQSWTVARWNDFYTTAQSSEEIVEVDLDANEKDAYLAGHKIDGRVLFPAAGYIVLAWKFLAKRVGKPFDKVPVVLESTVFHQATILQKNSPVRFRVSILRATGEFEIAEAGTVVASGRIRLADEEDLPDMKPPTPPYDAVTYELESEDIYKELRLRGYEYGGCFQGLLKADIHQSCAKLKWEDNWVTFVDTLLQFSVLDTAPRALRIPVSIKTCKIDPVLHTQLVGNVDNQAGLDVVCEQDLSRCRAGGVIIQGIKTSVATPRNLESSAVLSEYKFIPYIDNETAQAERETIVREYVDVCNTVARQVFEVSDAYADILGLLQDCSRASEEVTLQDCRQLADDQGLLRVLAAVQEKMHNFSSSLESAVQSAINAFKENLERDRLNTALFQEDPLRHLLDVVVENTNEKKLRVLEIAAAENACILAHFVSSLITLSNMELKIDYVVAHPCPQNLAAEQVPEGVKIISSSSTSPNNRLPEADLIVVWVSTSTDKSLKNLLEQAWSVCRRETFVLVAHRTRLTPAETLLTATGGIELSAHTVKEVETMFRSQGFSLIGLKSNNLSALMLLRKAAVGAETLKQVEVQVGNTKCDWVETLKATVRDYDTQLPEQRLWLVAEDRAISGVVGLTNCLRQETPECRIRCIFNADLKETNEEVDISPSNPKLTGILAEDLVMNVYRNGEWGSFRLTGTLSGGVQKKATEFAFLNVARRGDLSSLEWYESPLQYVSPSSAASNNICSVYYAPLNFRDVMLASGKLPPDALPDNLATCQSLLGLEFSGRDRHGRRVMGLLASEGMATMVAANPSFLWEVPESWSLEEASTVPVAYATAYYALIVRGQMRPGESVLVHSGSGGVGQAAISVALATGCSVFTTTGSREKREFLMRRFPQLKERNFANSRDLSFEEHILRETKGRGVDLVLNSLAGEMLEASVRCLATHGRFLEIGKVDLSKDSPLGMSVFLKSVAFHGILLEALQVDSPSASEERRLVVNLIQDGIASGAVRPLNSVRFMPDGAEKAFRFIASGKHMGKVVLEIRPEESQRTAVPAKPLTMEAVPRTYFYEHKSYVIVGGLGGIGLELADWMVKRGCRRLLLTTRSGVRTGYQKLCLRRWQQECVHIVVTKEDASTENGSQQIIAQASAMGPIGGIFNLGVVLRDGLLENQTVEAFETVLRIKIDATQHLDNASRRLCPALDHFVVFSSLTSSYGNVGQTNYGYANSAMERICERRASDGLPALAIQWGPVGDVGVFRELVGSNAVFNGTMPQPISSCLAALDRFMALGRTVVSSFVKAEPDSKTDIRQNSDIVLSIARVFGLKDPSSLNPNISLRELGMDSLMAVQVKQTIERECDFTLSMQEIRRITLNELRNMSEGRSTTEVDSSGIVAQNNSKEYARTLDDRPLALFESPAPGSTLIDMNTVCGGCPVFLVHPIEGHVGALMEMAANLPLRAVGVQWTPNTPVESVRDMATAYLQEILKRHPSGPYHLVGYSFGGAVAFEMALQLQASGQTVASLTFLDTAPLYLATVTAHSSGIQYDKRGDQDTVLLCAFLMRYFDTHALKVEEEIKQHPDLGSKQAAAVEVLLKTNPSMRDSREDTNAAMSIFYSLGKAGLNYDPKTKFHGDITLVKPSRPLVGGDDVSSDYGASDWCDGNVEIKVVEGYHESFILGQGAKECAAIISQKVQP